MPDGNEIQNSTVYAGIADTAIARFAQVHTPPPQMPMWAKWIAGGFGTVFSGAVLALGFWLFSSVSDMKETLARMDERQTGQVTFQNARVDDLTRRVLNLEDLHKGDGK